MTVYNLLLASWKGNLGIFGYLGYNLSCIMWCLWKDRHIFKAKELSMPLLKFLYLKIIYKCTPNLIQAFFDSLLSLELVKWKPLFPLSRTLLFKRGPSTFFEKILVGKFGYQLLSLTNETIFP